MSEQQICLYTLILYSFLQTYRSYFPFKISTPSSLLQFIYSIQQKNNPNKPMFSFFQKNSQQPNPRTQMVSPKRKPLSQIFYQEKSVKLPHGFAQSIMDLEMQLEFPETYSLDAVMKLNQLYRIAIEHYIDEDPRKANHFQRKLTTLLTNPQSLELMDKKVLQNKQKSTNAIKSPQCQNKVSVACSYSTNLRKEINQFNCQSDILVKSIIEGTDKKVQRNHRFVENQLISQEEKLKVRLEQRSRSKKQRSIDVKQ